MSVSSTTYTLQTIGAAETHGFGRALGEALIQIDATGIVVALHGNLGAGKTLLTQGIAAGLGITARVTSPTFIFVNEYPTATGQTLVHIDCYRLGGSPNEAALEAFTFGLEEILEREDAIAVIEWADRLHSLLPTDHLSITLTNTASTNTEEQSVRREVRCMAYGPTSSVLLATTQQLYYPPLKITQ